MTYDYTWIVGVALLVGATAVVIRAHTRINRKK